MHPVIQEDKPLLSSDSQLRVVLIALLTGQVLFVGVVFYLTSSGGFATQPELTRTLKLAFYACAAVLVVCEWLILGVVKVLQRREEDLERWNRRRVASVLATGAMAEAVGVLGATFLLLTGDKFFLAGPIYAVVELLRIMPSPRSGPREPEATRDGPSSHSHPIDP